MHLCREANSGALAPKGAKFIAMHCYLVPESILVVDFVSCDIYASRLFFIDCFSDLKKHVFISVFLSRKNQFIFYQNVLFCSKKCMFRL